MKKLLLILGLVAMFSLAASAKTPSTTYNFYFLTANGDPYCDGMVLKNYGNPQTLVDGFHFDIFCLLELGAGDVSVSVNGFLGPIPSNYQYGGGTGNVMIVGDPTVAEGDCIIPLIDPAHSTTDFLCQPFTGTSNLPNYPAAVYLINPTTHTWTLWVSGGGAGEYVANWGTFDPWSAPSAKASKSKFPFPRPSFAR